MAGTPRLTTIRRSATLAANAAGRDFVVGDLHGHRDLLEQELQRIGFDTTRDRLFSVGDLVDRGPDSLATLVLLDEPWFHAVLGNHELMLLNHLGHYSSRLHSRKAHAGGGGDWVAPALARQRRLVLRLADRLAALPLALEVAADTPFVVMHTDPAALTAAPAAPRGGNDISVHQADLVTDSRANIAEALQSELLRLPFGTHDVQLSATPLAERPLTYVGHSPVRRITVHRACIHIDQGVFAGNLRGTARSGAIAPTVLDHRQFAYWLAGVASAHCAPAALRPAAPRAPAPIALPAACT